MYGTQNIKYKHKIGQRIYSDKCFSISDMLSESSGSGEKAECSDDSPDIFAEHPLLYEEKSLDVKMQIEG
jgi:hypothetical protein